MSDMNDDFLKELQEECLKDSENRFGAMRTAIEEIPANPAASVKKICKLAQEMRGNLESVGFKDCSGLVGELVTQLTDLELAYVNLKGEPASDEAVVLQFFLGDSVRAIETYFDALKTDLKDSATRAEDRVPVVKILATWRPSAAAASAPEVQPPTEPMPVVVAMAPPSPSVASASPNPIAAAASAPLNAGAIVEGGFTYESIEDDEKRRHQFLICRTTLKSSIKPDVTQQRTFAIPISQVIEVIDAQSMNPLPIPRRGVAGIINFRGDPLPILVCYDRGQDGEANGGDKDYIVIARVEDKTFGFRMEQVLSVSDLDPKEFQTPGQWLATNSATWVTHLLKSEDEVVLVMDLKRALAA